MPAWTWEGKTLSSCCFHDVCGLVGQQVKDATHPRILKVDLKTEKDRERVYISTSCHVGLLRGNV